MQQKQETIFEDSRFLKNENELNQLQSSEVYLPHRKVQLLKENIKKLNDVIHYYDDANLQIRILAKLGEYNATLSAVLASIVNPTQRDIADQLESIALAQEYNPETVNKLDEQLATSLQEEEYFTQILGQEFGKQIEIEKRCSKLRFFKSDTNKLTTQDMAEEEHPGEPSLK
ncbi:hypothetical protein [Legionella sp. WA2024007413]